MNLPTYSPTWLDNDTQGDALWIVYDQCEGFQPAYALVFADNANDAADVAFELALDIDQPIGPDGQRSRLDPESESLVVTQVHAFS